MSYAHAVVAAVVIALTQLAPARADDRYDSSMARAVRAATEQYRLSLWATQDGYVQTTDYISGFGTMYTNHDRFDPADLAHPTALVYDESGRLVACGYQFTHAAPYPAEFAGVPTSAWYAIPKHVHYNVSVDGVMHFGQAPWDTSDPPTLANLRARNYVPTNGSLVFAFVHPAVHAFVIWAWRANDDGLYAGDNPALP